LLASIALEPSLMAMVLMTMVNDENTGKNDGRLTGTIVTAMMDGTEGSNVDVLCQTSSLVSQ
jgi:hypothetical protein